MPWVEVPDIAEVDGAFDEGRDPYAAYADAVIGALEADVSGGVVVAREAGERSSVSATTGCAGCSGLNYRAMRSLN
ncbi:hypothetical protein [Sorangium sp. So ce1389]|uniref:hypothetical protein n=1 Tax=Sorangium sp. So ce1389 TaxID=3133336 RepID=UPI003F5DCB17